MIQQIKMAEESIRRRIGSSIDSTFESASKIDTINQHRSKMDTIKKVGKEIIQPTKVAGIFIQRL